MQARFDGNAIRRHILHQSRRANVGHIGSALGVADIIAVLYSDVLRGVGTDDSERDVFVLSKGHAALALYSALHLSGVISEGQLDTYCADGSLLGVHPEHQLPGVHYSTGSLGHGLSAACGMAVAARMRGSAARVFVLMSDAELNEGSVWEATMFAAHHRLGTLTAILDDNGQQALGRTADVLDLSPVERKWEAFGWDVVTVDGHDPAALRNSLAGGRLAIGAPRMVRARTVSGRGVSFMEGQVAWHYLPMSEEQFESALSGLEH